MLRAAWWAGGLDFACRLTSGASLNRGMIGRYVDHE
jgi:hypothetical protein